MASVLALGAVAPATAASRTEVIVLPGATSAEAITAGPGDTFYAADMLRGTIYRGDIRTGTAQVFIEPPAGTQTVGMDLDVRDGLLFVAGGLFLLYRGMSAPHGLGRAYVKEVRINKNSATDLRTTFVDAKPTEQGAKLSVSRTVGLWISAFLTRCLFMCCSGASVDWRRLVSANCFIGQKISSRNCRSTSFGGPQSVH